MLLKRDNTTVVAYMNTLGRMVSPKLNMELWLWCINQDVTLVTKHMPAWSPQYNADQEGMSDWMLNPRIFNKIQQKWDPLEVDVFASRLTTQLKSFSARG